MFLGACRRRRRRGGLQLYRLRAAWGATGQLSGIRLGLWVSASGGAAQSASMFIRGPTHPIRGATLNLFQKTWVLGSGNWVRLRSAKSGEGC